MVKCPKCKCDEYYELYSDDYDYEEDSVTVRVRVECSECGKKFWIKERFKFESAENVKRE